MRTRSDRPITNRARIRKRAAFTLTEVSITMTIIAILSSVAVPRFSSSMHYHRAEVAARRVLADLNYASMEAQNCGRSLQVTFSAADHKYTLAGVSPLDGGTGDYTTYLNQEPYDVELTSADFGGDAILIFDGFGAADTAGTIELTSGQRQKTIVIDADSGRARVQ